MNMTFRFDLIAWFFLVIVVAGCSNPFTKKGDAVTQRPNILFCIADDATFQHMGAYGCEFVNTPAFDRVAKEGLLFLNAYTPNAKCAPSRSILLTGRNSWQLEEAGNHWSYFPQKFKTYAESLKENGYHVGYTAKGLSPVVALTKEGNKRPVLGKTYNEHKLVPPTKAISNIDYAANFDQFLSEKKEDEPFCFWYGGLEPHRAYEYGSGVKKGNKSIDDIHSVFSFWPDSEEVRNDILDYAFEIEYFDSHLGKMIRTLEENEQLENTLIVVTSDNGMPFPRIKGQAYEYSNHLPLAIMWKGKIIAPGRVIEDFVNFTDMAPTFLELAGVEQAASGMEKIQGTSLTDIFFSHKSGIVSASRDHVLIGKERHDVGRPNDVGYPIRGIRKDDYLFIINYEVNRWPVGNPITGYLNTDGGATKTKILNDRRNGVNLENWALNFGKRAAFELYNIKNDPDCIENLADQKAYKEISEALKNQLEKELKEQKDPRMFGNGEIFESYLYANEKDRNFYQRHMNGENPKAGWVNKTDFEKTDN
jgi:arylsulfatase A-like enzyme